LLPQEGVEGVKAHLPKLTIFQHPFCGFPEWPGFEEAVVFAPADFSTNEATIF
jgi:hypothetical protein